VKTGRRIGWTLVACLMVGAALAADATLESAQRCAQVQDSLQRLVCYDRLFAPAQAPAVPSPRPAPVVTPAPVAAPAPIPSPLPAPVVARAPAAVPVPVAPGAEEQFGAETVKRADERKEEVAAPRTITAAVVAVREMRPNVYRVTLENGQVWDQMDMDMTFTVRKGDTVQIDRGRMGGYRMARTSQGGSGWVRVSRNK
jgi:hypothetical protein